MKGAVHQEKTQINAKKKKKCLLLSERRQLENVTYFMIPTLQHSGKGRIGLKRDWGDFPGSPVVKTTHFQCRGHGFDPWMVS